MSKDEPILLTTQRFRVVEVTRRLADGSTRTRAVVRHPGAVVVLPVVDDEHVCLIKQFRVSVGKTLIEVPAGTLEPSEPPAACAARELSEETGFSAGRLVPLQVIYPSPGIMDEAMHCFVALDLTAGSPHREHGEEIENLIISWDEALALIDRGVIRDSKTIATVLLAERRRRTGFQQTS